MHRRVHNPHRNTEDDANPTRKTMHRRVPTPSEDSGPEHRRYWETRPPPGTTNRRLSEASSNAGNAAPSGSRRPRCAPSAPPTPMTGSRCPARAGCSPSSSITAPTTPASRTRSPTWWESSSSTRARACCPTSSAASRKRSAATCRWKSGHHRGHVEVPARLSVEGLSRFVRRHDPRATAKKRKRSFPDPSVANDTKAQNPSFPRKRESRRLLERGNCCVAAPPPPPGRGNDGEGWE